MQRRVRRGAAVAALASALLVCGTLVTGCREDSNSLQLWAMGREGEVVQELVHDFERLHPGIHVRVQQIPWSAAHEKLLTAYVGRSTPDVAQLGNTWVSEFSALNALEPLDPWVARSTTVARTDFFDGIWDTNVIDNVLYGVPWYVDTRVLFYRKDLLTKAGWDSLPSTWPEWKRAMQAVKRAAGPGKFAILLPVNEWPPAIILGLQAGSKLLRDSDTRGAFSEPEFRTAFDFYLDLFRSGLAPPVTNNDIANVYNEFAKGYFSMYITGPWNLGEFARRLPPELQNAWATAPIPGMDAAHPGVSLAGGSSLVLFRSSHRKEAAWQLVEYLSQPEVQLRFYRSVGDLPARVEAWRDTSLSGDARIRAFGKQLEHVVSTPKIPEWELITTRVQERTELAVRGGASADSALALLDRDVNRMLEKRRWLIQRAHAAAHTAGAGGP